MLEMWPGYREEKAKLETAIIWTRLGYPHQNQARLGLLDQATSLKSTQIKAQRLKVFER